MIMYLRIELSFHTYYIVLRSQQVIDAIQQSSIEPITYPSGRVIPSKTNFPHHLDIVNTGQFVLVIYTSKMTITATSRLRSYDVFASAKQLRL